MPHPSILVFQHIPCEGPGRMVKYAEDRGVSMEYVHFIEGGTIPTRMDHEMLLVLGGSMNVYEEEQYPWLAKETEFIRRWVDAGKPYLGLCLGGQLLAKAVNGKVTKNRQKELGNFSVSLTVDGLEDPLFKGFPQTFPVFQWHGDTFSELGGGVCLATSELCPHQAFRVGSRAYALQFHVEITKETAREWLHEYNHELIEEKLDPAPIYAEFAQLEGQYEHLSELLFENFFQIAGIRGGRAPTQANSP